MFRKCELAVFFIFDGQIGGSGSDKLTSLNREGNYFVFIVGRNCAQSTGGCVSVTKPSVFVVSLTL